MGKIYKVVFNNDVGSGNNSVKTFFYDWSKLEQGQYKCSFSMICAFAGNPNLSVIPAVFMNLGQSETLIARPFNAGVFGTSYMLPSFIGTLGVNVLQNNPADAVPVSANAFADLEDNPPFYLQQLPNNNIIQIAIYIARGSPFPTTYNPGLIGRWTLSLHLEKID